jgi:hypothetical protein
MRLAQVLAAFTIVSAIFGAFFVIAICMYNGI